MRAKVLLPILGLVVAGAVVAAVALASHPRVDPLTVPTGFLVAHNQISHIPLTTLRRTMKKGRADVFVEHVRLGPGESTPFHRHPAPVFISIARGSVTLEEAIGTRCKRKTIPVDLGFVARPRRVFRLTGGSQGADYFAFYVTPRGTGATVQDVGAPAACGA
jgi:hypothetical protein